MHLLSRNPAAIPPPTSTDVHLPSCASFGAPHRLQGSLVHLPVFVAKAAAVDNFLI